MNVGDSVRIAIADWERGEFEASMLHACNAVDGTARKAYPQLRGNYNKTRFTTLLRDEYAVLGAMGIPGINLMAQRFPIPTLRGTTLDTKPDLADVIYGMHRCRHAHGEELPDGFELLADAAGLPGVTRIHIERGGRVRLSDRIIFGLLAVAVVSPTNVGQRVPDGYHLTFGRLPRRLPINEWWGRRSEFLDVLAQEPLPNCTLGFAAWEPRPVNTEFDIT